MAFQHLFRRFRYPTEKVKHLEKVELSIARQLDRQYPGISQLRTIARGIIFYAGVLFLLRGDEDEIDIHKVKNVIERFFSD